MLSKPGLFDAPSAVGSSSPQSDYLQPNLAYSLRIWWAYYWPTFLISFFITGILMVLLRQAWENVTISGWLVLWANRILPYVAFFGVSVLSIRRILGKEFRHFRIVLLPRDTTSGIRPLPRSLRRTIRVWWAFSWRALVCSVIIRVAGSIALSLPMGILSEIGRTMAVVVPMVFQTVIDGAVGTFVIYSWILEEEFGDFRVTLLPRRSVAQAASSIEPATSNPIPQ
jgi:hypothetical protein